MTPHFQCNLFGQEEFSPPRYNLCTFLDHIADRRPNLLNPSRHGDLIIAFAHYVGLEPDRWSKNISSIAWLMKVSPDIQRACRQYRANA